MAEIIEWLPNDLGFPCVICAECKSETFNVEFMDDEDGLPVFSHLHCTECGNEIPVFLKPCFPSND